MNGIEHITARRAWIVPAFSVWGAQPTGDEEYLTLTTIDGVNSVYYDIAVFEQTEQEVMFCDLVDHRGNNLPGTIQSPAVVLRPRSSSSVFLVGQESGDRFRIAHDAAVTTPASVDLLIFEMGD